MAERVGFEPTKGYSPLLVFKTSAFGRSATSPRRPMAYCGCRPNRIQLAVRRCAPDLVRQCLLASSPWKPACATANTDFGTTILWSMHC